MSENDPQTAKQWNQEYEKFDATTKQYAALWQLWLCYLHMAAWGTPDYEEIAADDQAIFRELVESDRLYDFVEETKHLLLRSGLGIPDRWLWPICAASIREGQALSADTRTELRQITTEIFTRLPRLHPDAQPPKPKPIKDISGDTLEKKKKTVRRIRVEHVDCDRIYEEAKKKGFPLTQAQVVQDYLDENPKCKLTPAALLKGWQAFRKERSKKDT